MFRTCVSTVRGLRNISSAISRSVCPAARWRITSSSRGVSPPCASCAAASRPRRRSARSPSAASWSATRATSGLAPSRRAARCAATSRSTASARRSHATRATAPRRSDSTRSSGAPGPASSALARSNWTAASSLWPSSSATSPSACESADAASPWPVSAATCVSAAAHARTGSPSPSSPKTVVAQRAARPRSGAPRSLASARESPGSARPGRLVRLPARAPPVPIRTASPSRPARYGGTSSPTRAVTDALACADRARRGSIPGFPRQPPAHVAQAAASRAHPGIAPRLDPTLRPAEARR